MPVVINEFEVVPAPAEQAPDTRPADRPAPSGPSPRDIERIVEHAVERERRVRAH